MKHMVKIIFIIPLYMDDGFCDSQHPHPT